MRWTRDHDRISDAVIFVWTLKAGVAIICQETKEQERKGKAQALRSENKIGRTEGFLRTHMTLFEHPIGVYN